MAIKAVFEALNGLDQDATRRVLDWAIQRFDPQRSHVARISTVPPAAREPSAAPAELGELFSVAAPGSGPEKALVVAYFMQEVQGLEHLEAQTLNSELKHLGHQLPNVTATLSLLMNQQPAAIVQVRKTGKSRQARKLYRLTAEGVRRVRAMLAHASSLHGSEK